MTINIIRLKTISNTGTRQTLLCFKQLDFFLFSILLTISVLDEGFNRIETMVNLRPGIGNLSIYPIRCLYTSYILSLDNSRTHKYVTMDTATYQLGETVSNISQSE